MDWCASPLPIRENIVSRLSKRQIDNVCQTNKICRANVCKKDSFWTQLVQKRFGKDVPTGVNPRKFYHELNTSLWGKGDNRFGTLGLADSIIRNEKFIYPEVKQVNSRVLYTAFVTHDNELYVMGSGNLGLGDVKDADRPTKIMDKVNRVLCLNNTMLVLDNQNNLYMTGSLVKSNYLVWVMSNVQQVVATGTFDFTVQTLANEWLTSLNEDSLGTEFTYIARYALDTSFDKYFDASMYSQHIKGLLSEVAVFLDEVEKTDQIKSFDFKRDDAMYAQVIFTDNVLLSIFKEDGEQEIIKTFENVSLATTDLKRIYWTEDYMLNVSDIEYEEDQLFVMKTRIIKLLAVDDNLYILCQDGTLYMYNDSQPRLQTSDVKDFVMTQAVDLYIRY